MKLLPSALAGIALATSAPAVDQIVTLGDSLTFAYEGSFAFQETIFGNTVGDGFNSTVRNWIELLSSSSYREDFFDLGTRDTIRVQKTLFPATYANLYLRQLHNWAIPGLEIDQLRRFVNGDATLYDLLNEDPDFAQLVTLLQASDFQESDFDVVDLESQITSVAERVTLFIGGNDLRGIYGTIYNGGSAGTFVADFIDDAAFILDWVLALNPTVEIVVVAVPHVGITPDIKSTYPTDPLKTPLVTALTRDLNTQLKGLADARGLGFADIFTPTLPLLEADPLCIHGIPFFNTGSTTGDLDYVWLNGALSANFHPNTNAQAVIANVIVDAFNSKYDTGIAPLTATEILGGMLGKTAGQIDMPFATWMDCFGLTGLPESDDSDGDNVPAGVEFGLGLDPTMKDGHKIVRSLVNGGTELELAYPLRLTSSTRFTLTPASGTDPASMTPFAVAPAPEADGLARAAISLSGSRGFLQLQSVITP
ncbi:hypothetical protein [Haloferula helveola]|uniref:hypothetical protein n=1 Tax=Haloferula helveola TaxID=490095 RepID=UPI0030D3D9A4